MNDQQLRGKYPREFKLEAVRLVKTGPSAGVTAKVLGIPKASLSNWVRSGEQARVKMERDIEKKWQRRTLRRMLCKVRLDLDDEDVLAGEPELRGAGVSVSGYFEHRRRQQRRRPSQSGSGHRSEEAPLAHWWWTGGHGACCR